MHAKTKKLVEVAQVVLHQDNPMTFVLLDWFVRLMAEAHSVNADRVL
jgi:hypothetical protein